jgi:hypothetical protein
LIVSPFFLSWGDMDPQDSTKACHDHA